ncbi:MAG: acetyl-CoA carboxylase biotin carboxylase subunit [Mycobacterium sp.]|jgi:acetyl-CoA carboxylase biotin carboxylase subunit|nr:acetyl-CoA carboxylase biotin carboxylase subunit [Mycobacterium sp.]
MFETVMVAGRGEIARRVIRTLRRLEVRSVAVYSEADQSLPYVAEADEAVLLGPADPAQSYLDAARLIEAARRSGAQAVHPCYGFLSESADFAEQVQDAGLVWIGPPPAAMRGMADKIAARQTMQATGVPVAAGTASPVITVEAALTAAAELGYPLMVKASAGGGGIGMGSVHDDAGLRTVFASAQSRAQRLYGSSDILLERYLQGARHVEVQILGLGDGRIVALGERDCSVQRRHQKIAEESPSPAVGPELRARLFDAAVRAGNAVGYVNAGTVECLVQPDTQEFVFLEMNTRLQVEHPITEMVTGIDLVEEQLRVAAGLEPTFGAQPPPPQGNALEMRVYAEDPVRFLPGPGTISRYEEPAGEGIRVDSGYADGDVVTPHYDPLLAKLCVWGPDRATMLARATQAVAGYVLEGPKVNLPFFTRLLADPAFVSGDYDTGLVAAMGAARK